MKQSEYDELVKATLPNIAGSYNGGVAVIPLTKELQTVIDCGLEELKKTIEKDNINDELLIKLCEKLMENGICAVIQPLADDISPYKNGYKIEIDFTKHDKVFEDKIANLEKQIKFYEVQKKELRTRCMDTARDSFDKGMYGCLTIVSHPKETEPINDSAPSMEWYENRHQSDCIEINRLNTTIEVLIHKIEHLRQFAGLE